jgi:hypothetical protein
MRCVNCGSIDDPVIFENRLIERSTILYYALFWLLELLRPEYGRGGRGGGPDFWILFVIGTCCGDPSVDESLRPGLLTSRFTEPRIDPFDKKYQPVGVFEEIPIVVLHFIFGQEPKIDGCRKPTENIQNPSLWKIAEGL